MSWYQALADLLEDQLNLECTVQSDGVVFSAEKKNTYWVSFILFTGNEDEFVVQMNFSFFYNKNLFVFADTVETNAFIEKLREESAFGIVSVDRKEHPVSINVHRIFHAIERPDESGFSESFEDQIVLEVLAMCNEAVHVLDSLWAYNSGQFYPDNPVSLLDVDVSGSA